MSMTVGRGLAWVYRLGLACSLLVANLAAAQDPPDALQRVADFPESLELASCFDSCDPLLPESMSCESHPLVASRWEFDAEFLYWKPRQRGLDFAVSEDGTNLILGRGVVHNFDYDRDAGFRGAIGYRTQTGWTLRLGYTGFETESTATAERPAGIGQLFATRSHPDGNEEADRARVDAEFNYRTYDLLAERPVFVNDFARYSLVGGLRWIDFRQQFRYAYDGRDFVNGEILDRTSMDGMGVRIGGEAMWKFSHGWGAFGRMAAGVAYGRFNSTLQESNQNHTQTLVDIRDRFDQALPSLEAAVGLSWSWNQFSIRSGYELINWFNLAERSMFVDDIQEGTYTPLSQDVLLEGLFVQFVYVR